MSRLGNGCKFLEAVNVYYRVSSIYVARFWLKSGMRIFGTVHVVAENILPLPFSVFFLQL
jgi:hypothetical protein